MNAQVNIAKETSLAFVASIITKAHRNFIKHYEKSIPLNDLMREIPDQLTNILSIKI